MNLIDNLLAVAAEYGAHRNLSPARVSTLVFNDGKKLTLLMRGESTVTLPVYERSMRWFSKHWPSGATWPLQYPDSEWDWAGETSRVE
jgi:hypothetical protein